MCKWVTRTNLLSIIFSCSVLVTHGVTFLPECDQIIVIKDGKVSERGTYKDLLAKEGDFAEFLIEYMTQTEDEELDEETKEALTKSDKEGKLVRQISEMRERKM